ncbi:Bug family tripartite tricarboxylate transporter substrate binding protein [Paracidovorax valerianellae]|uniref:Tripartite-type tricarboxylate transporter, receptor component TctC n=1 Tax=Paracidovorax valerianellae TaxID=187868 RepID=A0A1G6UYM5_9BURK|nr:tripartite tricarboxylate transporter substrate binding protein [Paracidovorax valerianellae]MDA8447512.1 tripartite tricarboxylate transporter substrate binding protein [Paracidovorax valerianellae]SDD46374.1 Tripartite-type tricarboxylate transporter, receptor component TctC [Paracidovorax valerianellae]
MRSAFFNRSFTRRAGLALLLGALAPWAAQAQQDSRPIEWVVGYAAGGGSDVLARATAEAMGKRLAQPIVITNKPGAATNIAADYVARSRDFGHVMLTADFATLAANPFLFSKLSYSAEKDLAPVGMLARFPLVLVVGPQVPAKNWSEFVAWAKAQPDGVNYASAGAGSPHHLASELLREKTGIKMAHVPYRGAAPAMQDVLGGSVPFMLVDTASGNAFVLGGKVRAIGVASAQRIATLPDVPTLQEQGLAGFEAYAWQGVSVPAGTPPETIAKLNKALVEALNSTEVKARFQALGVDGMPGTPQDMARYVKSERERWGRLIRDNGIRLD